MRVMEALLLLLLLQVAPFCNTAASENERPVRQMPGSNGDHPHAHPHPDTSPQVEYGPTSFDSSAQPHPATGYSMPGDQPYPSSEYPIPGAQPYSASGYPIPGAQPYPASGYPIPGAQPYPASGYPIPGAQPYPASGYPISGAQPYPASGYPISGAQPYPLSGYGPPVEQPYPAAGFAPAPQYAPDAGYAPGPQYAPLPAPQYAPDAGYGPIPQYAPYPAPQYAPDAGYAPVPQYAPLPAPQYVHMPSYVPPPVHGVAPAPVYPGEPAYAPAPQYVPETAYPPAPVVAPAPIYAPGYIPAPAVEPPVQVLPGHVQPTAVRGCNICGASVVPSYTTTVQVRYVPGASYRQLMCGQKVTCGYRIVTRPGSYVYYRTNVPMPVTVPQPQPLPLPIPVPLPQPRPVVIIRPAPVPPRMVYTCPQQTCPQQPVLGGCGYVQPAGPPACATHQGCQLGQQCCYNPTRGGVMCGQGIATALRARRHMQIVSPMSGPSRVELLIGQWRDRNVTSLVTQWLLPLKMDLEDFIEISFATRTKCRGRGVDCISAKVLNCIVDIEEQAFNNARTSPEDEESRRVTREALFSDLSVEYGENSHEFFESPSAGDWLQSHDEFLDTLHEDQYYQNAWQLHNASGVTSYNAASNIDYIFQPDWENLNRRNYSIYAEHQDLAPEALNQGILLQEAPEKEDQRLFHQGVAPEAVHHGLASEAVSSGLLHQALTPEAIHQNVLPQSLTPEVVDERLLPQSASLANEKQVRLLSFAACLLQSVQAGVAEKKKSSLLAAKRCVRAYGYDWQRVRRCAAQDDGQHEGGDEGVDLNGEPVEVTVNEIPIRAEGNLELSLCYTLNKFGIEPVLCDMLYDRLDEQREKENGQSGNGEENGSSLQTENVLVADSSGLDSADIAGYTVTRNKNSNNEIIVPIYRKDSP